MIVIVVVVHAVPVRVCVRRLCGCLGADMFYLASTFVSLGPLQALTTPANTQVRAAREREWLLTNGALRPSRPGLPVRAREHGVRAPRATAAAAPAAALSSCAAAGGVLWWRCTRTSPRAWPLVGACSREYAAAAHLPSRNGREPTAARATTGPHHLIAALPWQRWDGSQPLAF